MDQSDAINTLREKLESHAGKLAAWDVWYSQWSAFLKFLWTWFKDLFWAVKPKDEGGEYRRASSEPSMTPYGDYQPAYRRASGEVTMDP